MTRHLPPDALVSVLDGAADARALEHLRTCAACQDALRVRHEMRATLLEAGDDVPEPAELFWGALNARIRHATAEEALPGRWWTWGPRVWGPAVGALAAVAVIVVAWQPRRLEAPAPLDAALTTLRPPVVGAEASWETVGAIAATLSVDDVRLVVGPSAEAGIDELTPPEREAFVRLLDLELGSQR